MKTIAKNRTRAIAEITEAVTRCRVFSLRNDFHGVDVDQKHAWADLHTYDFARLVEMEPGRHWHINIHGNLWYELHADPDSGERQ